VAFLISHSRQHRQRRALLHSLARCHIHRAHDAGAQRRTHRL